MIDDEQFYVNFSAPAVNEVNDAWSLWHGATETLKITDWVIQMVYQPGQVDEGNPWRLIFNNGNIDWLPGFTSGPTIPDSGFVAGP
jgi:hypothetical protein